MSDLVLVQLSTNSRSHLFCCHQSLFLQKFEFEIYAELGWDNKHFSIWGSSSLAKLIMVGGPFGCFATYLTNNPH